MKPISVGSITLSAALAAALVTGCSSSDASDTHEGTDGPSSTSPVAAEVSTAQPRLALTYDGGVLVVDATELDVVSDLPLDGFNRVAPTGDGRHVVVSTSGAFRTLDTGSWTEPHGDHSHHYAGDPAFTDPTVSAEKPGHVVHHGDVTALFDDGTGNVTFIDSTDLEADPDTYTAPDPHHGVAVPLDDGSLLVTEGTADGRSSIVLLDDSRQEQSRTDDCPGVHGETVAADDAVVFGCEDGAVIFRDGTFTKVAAPDAYGRIGNQAGSDESPVVLGDYKTDPDADPERPERVALIDTRTAQLTIVDLGTSYTFRSLARGPHGEALILGTDGALHVVDPGSGEITERIDVVAPWTEPDEWQSPRPAVTVRDHVAYVTEPATNELHAVDLDSGAVATATLPRTPNEITAA
ncbi:zinc metallochaperone AztD [Rhodococcus yananensis]|uniref:zinc metallochaperone AztD n=1 Tax=Rhodococcus yananensis TaxID=2879464 RepID=UPI001CF92C47|nr:zinc metallochaperone AztD [Rhodococcus yananensis]